MVRIIADGITGVAGIDAVVSEGFRPNSIRLLVDQDFEITAPTFSISIVSDNGTVRFNNLQFEKAFYRAKRTAGGKLRRWIVAKDERSTWDSSEFAVNYNDRTWSGSIVDGTARPLNQMIAEVAGGLGILASPTLQAFFPKAKGVYTLKSFFDETLGKIGCTLGWDAITGRWIAVPPKAHPNLSNWMQSLWYSQPTGLPLISKRVVTRSSPIVFRPLISLESSAIDIDGDVKLLDNASYAPVSGWEYQQPGLQPDVNGESARPIAAWSAGRLFSAVSATTSTQSASGGNLEILPDQWGYLGKQRSPLRPVLSGTWLPPSSRVNVVDGEYTGGYRIVEGNRVLVDQPLRLLDDGELLNPDLTLEANCYFKEFGVPVRLQLSSGIGKDDIWTIDYLTEVRANPSCKIIPVNSGAQQELALIHGLHQIKASQSSSMFSLSGIIPVDVDGSVTTVRYVVENGEQPLTEVFFGGGWECHRL